MFDPSDVFSSTDVDKMWYEFNQLKVNNAIIKKKMSVIIDKLYYQLIMNDMHMIERIGFELTDLCGEIQCS